MTIAERMLKELKSAKQLFQDDSYFLELERFYTAMLEKGVAKRQEYSLPLPDTIGSNLTHNSATSTNKNLID